MRRSVCDIYVIGDSWDVSVAGMEMGIESRLLE